MPFLLAVLSIFFSVQEKEQELKTHFEIRVETTLFINSTDVVEVTPHQMTRVRDSWRVENSLPLMISLDLDETEYLHELITSEEFRQIESPSTYECIDADMLKGSPRFPVINLHVTVEEAGEKDSKNFTFNCLCTDYPATDAPEVLCNILDDVNRLDIEHLQR